MWNPFKRKHNISVFGKTINREQHTIRYRKQVRGLQPLLIRLLEILYQHRGRVVSKEELKKALWPNTIVTEDSLTKAISKLRKFLDYGLSQSAIQTVNGNGYVLRKSSWLFQVRHNLLVISLSTLILFLIYFLFFSGLVQWAIEAYAIR